MFIENQVEEEERKDDEENQEKKKKNISNGIVNLELMTTQKKLGKTLINIEDQIKLKYSFQDHQLQVKQ